MIEINRKISRMFSMLGQRGSCGYALSDLATNNNRILCMTSDLCTTSGLDRFNEAFPERMLNVGIAEQNMIGVAAGLAIDGYKVFASTFATFASMRAVEQLRSMLAYMELDVKLIGMASGFSMGFFGNTHYSMEDIAITRAIPNLTVLSPADATETVKILEAVSRLNKPCYIRLTGSGNMPIVYNEEYSLEIGKAIKLTNGNDICIISTGSMVYQSLQAAKMLEEEGISSTVLDVHTIKPFDNDSIVSSMEKYKLIVTVEEHSVIGGLGGAVSEVLSKYKNHPPLLRIGVEDMFPRVGDYSYLIEQCGLTAEQIKKRIIIQMEHTDEVLK